MAAYIGARVRYIPPMSDEQKNAAVTDEQRAQLRESVAYVLDTRWFKETLENDVHAARAAIRAGLLDDGFSRRAYVRAVFAEIEGLTWKILEGCKRRAAVRPHVFSPEQLARIEAETTDRSAVPQGTPAVKPRFLPTQDAVKFAFSVWLYGVPVAAPPIVFDGGWQSFLSALDLRHRLAHPKQPQDLVVSDAEITTVEAGQLWFLRTYWAHEQVVDAALAAAFGSKSQ